MSRIAALRGRLVRFWNNPTERNWLRWLSKSLWILAIAGVLFAFGVIATVAFGDLPDFADLENPKYDLASIIYDANGESFGKYYIENREFVTYDDLSDNVKNALFSVEDERFFRHSGIDFQALTRVAFKSVLLGQSGSGGGSTISQQLAKLLFSRESLGSGSKFSRAVALAKVKFKEWITAVKLERSYTKEEIVAMYLSKFEFINGAHGIQSAAEIYFGKNQSDLTVSESATLVGMLQNPARFNPVRFEQRARGRRNTVLSKMKKQRHIDRSTLDTLMAHPIDLSRFDRASQSDGVAPYFRSELTKFLKDLLLKQQYHKPDGGAYDIYRDGLKIYTTIDLRYQKLAEEAMWEHLKTLQERYWKVWKGMDPIRYQATTLQRQLREQSVQRRVRDTELYKNLFSKYFKAIMRDAKKEYNLDVKEPTIRRLMADPGYAETLPADVKKGYRAIVRSERTVAQWEAFQKDLDAKMEEKTMAKVFAYNEQRYEEKEMTRRDSIIYHIRHMQSGLLSVVPQTGAIKAWVGGVDHHYFKYDHVTMRRQVGSTIKPFVYATAIGVQGIPPCQEFSDIQYTIAPGDAGFLVDAEWSPANANGLFTGNKYNLYQGLLYSKNSITIRIVKEMGTIELVRDLLDNVGIDKRERLASGRLMLPDVPSIALGSVDLSLLEMAGGYTTFANNGTYTKPYFIERIEDKNGKIIYQNSTVQRRAINPLYNAVMVDMLKNNTGGGFGLGLKSANGGKTGTTNDYADGWFMGITPNLVTGVWVGGDEKWVRFYTLDDGQGFVMARPIYKNYLKKVEESEEIDFDTEANFPDAPSGFSALTDCKRYKRKEPEGEQTERDEQKRDLDEFGDQFGQDAEDEFSTSQDSLKQ